jgi:hypothetical protein
MKMTVTVLSLTLIATSSWPGVRYSLLAADEAASMTFPQKFRMTLHAEKLEALAAENARLLDSSDSAAKREAVLFFVDLKAKPVLEEVLLTGDTAVLDTLVAAGGLESFTLPDVPILYQSCVRLAEEGTVLQAGGENLAIRCGVVDRLANRASELLGLEHKPLNIESFDLEGPGKVAAWWRRAVSMAKPQIKQVVQELDEVKQYFKDVN